MSTKSTEERIADLEKKMKQLQEQKKKILAREREQERKARNHRLIEIGATVESVLGRPIEKEDLPKLKFFLESQEKRGHFFTQAMAEQEPPSSIKK